ncbi:exodeoxyribonuclease VII small subunit, partial [Staphylococcus capitis]|uniref:exodeoxyribonuclease VII small subunit n=1 Tax=Staphylococcus capitis TaxID=29388 RepID=UPI0011A4BC5A
MRTKENQTFRQIIQQLQNILQKLHNQTLSLHQSLHLYQTPIKLSTPSHTTLKHPHKKLNKLIQQ